MKKYRIVLLILIVSLNLGFSQNHKKGVVIYSVKPIPIVKLDEKLKNKDIEMYRFFKKSQEKIEKASQFIEYKLKFNNKNSLFFINEILENDYGNGARYFDIGKIYTFSNARIHEKTQYGSKFLITSNLSNVKWKITNKTKLIGKYECFKATTIKKISNLKGTFYRNISAWYCPEIPIPFGPMGYGNLPGLIMELDIDKMGIYTMKEIILNTKDKIVINKPTKGKIVTEKEFDKIGMKIHQNRLNAR